MPKYTLSTVIQKALHGALEDRRSLADCTKGTEYLADVLKELADIEALRGLKFEKMSPEQQDVARMALIYAEQWDEGLADSLGCKNSYGKQAKRDAKMFRDYRRLHFGKTALEGYFDRAEVLVLGPNGLVYEKTGKPYDGPVAKGEEDGKLPSS